MKKFLVLIVAGAALTGCLGYHVGSSRPGQLRDIHAIAIPTFHNKTLRPRIEVLMTDTVIKQFQQDGTYRITSKENADATLEAEIVSILRGPARSVGGNVLATSEFNLSVRVHYTLFGRDGKPIAGPADAIGTTSFFVGPDVTTDERQALPLAAEELATRLVSYLTEGW